MIAPPSLTILLPGLQFSSPLTFTYKDQLTRDKVDDVDTVNMTGCIDTLSRQIL
jgi:hypothetical protein